MTTPDLKALSDAATPMRLDTAEITEDEGWFHCHMCDGSGSTWGNGYINIDGVALNVQFSGIGDEFKANERYVIALVNAHRAGQLFTAADVEAAVMAEREACAQICQKSSERRGQQASTAEGVQRHRWIAGRIEAETLADAIRARTTQEGET